MTALKALPTTYLAVTLITVMAVIPWCAKAATITVNSTDDNTTAGDQKCTLREALANANAAWDAQFDMTGPSDTTGGDCTRGDRR